MLCNELLSNCDLGERFTFFSEALAEYQDFDSRNSNNQETTTVTISGCCTKIHETFLQELVQFSSIASQPDKNTFLRLFKSVQFLEILTTKSKSFSCVLSVIEESLLVNLFENLTTKSISTYAQFLTWKYFAVLPIIPKNADVHIVLKLFLKDSCLEVKDNDFRTDFRTQFYQAKFNGLASFLTKSDKTVNDEDELLFFDINLILQKIINEVDMVGLNGVTSATSAVHSILDFLLHCYPHTFVYVRVLYK